MAKNSRKDQTDSIQKTSINGNAMNDVKLLSDETVDGVRTITAETCSEVCSSKIIVSVKDDIIQSAEIVDGCPGNTLGVCALVKGMEVNAAIDRLEGILCGSKSTSCPDQLTKVLHMF